MIALYDWPQSAGFPCDKIMKSSFSKEIANQFPTLNLDPEIDLLSQLFEIRKSNPINSQIFMDTDHAIFKIQSNQFEFTRQVSRKLVQQIQNNFIDVKTIKPNQFLVNSLFEKPFYWTPLHCACYYGKLNAVQQLLDMGYDIYLRDQWYGGFPLAWAAFNNHVDVCQYLISKGAAIVQTNFYHQSAFDIATSPLHPKWYFLHPHSTPESCHYLDILQILKETDLLQLFMELPDKPSYPDYYQIIKSPISIQQIEAKLFNFIKHVQPYSVEQFAHDLLLLFANAFTYNIPESNIYKNALFLQYQTIHQFNTKLNIQLNAKIQLKWERTLIDCNIPNIHLNDHVLLNNNTIMHIRSFSDDSITGTVFNPTTSTNKVPRPVCAANTSTTSIANIIKPVWVLSLSEHCNYTMNDSDNLYVCLESDEVECFTCPLYLLNIRTTPLVVEKNVPAVDSTPISNITYGSYLKGRQEWTLLEISKMMGIKVQDLQLMLQPLNPPRVLKFNQNAVEILTTTKSCEQLQIITTDGIGHVRRRNSNVANYHNGFSQYHHYKPQKYQQPSSKPYYHPRPQLQQQQVKQPQIAASSNNMINISELDELNMLQNIIMDAGENSLLYDIQTTEQKNYCITLPGEIDSLNVAPVINKRFYKILKEASDTSLFKSRVNFDFVQYYMEVTLNNDKLTSHMVDVSRSIIDGEEWKECLPNLIYYTCNLTKQTNVFEFKTVFRVFDYENVERVMNKSDSAVNLESAKEISVTTRPVFRYQNEQIFYIVVNRKI
eukprot:NODE_191_length_15469_cov_0.243071.p1 type:complete len:772 gc:universal NODE_191_length_15469_cov_0.243071:8444-10759(+)